VVALLFSVALVEVPLAPVALPLLKHFLHPLSMMSVLQ
jgi:hypothetical protein